MKKLLREYRVKKNPVDLIDRHHFLLKESIEIYTILKETIRLSILNHKSI